MCLTITWVCPTPTRVYFNLTRVYRKLARVCRTTTRVCPTLTRVCPERLIIYCQTTGVSAAHATHCATYCTPCRPLRRAFSGWIRTPPPTGCAQHSLECVQHRTLFWTAEKRRMRFGFCRCIASRTCAQRPLPSSHGHKDRYRRDCFQRENIESPEIGVSKGPPHVERQPLTPQFFTRELLLWTRLSSKCMIQNHVALDKT
jgi:hypothetical protein